jgi:diketogulonate reductase-like aldo/keto reductase
MSSKKCLELGTVPIPKTANPDHMKNDAEVDFTISAEDMETLKNLPKIENYGDSSIFPIYGGHMDTKGNYKPGKPF